MDQEDTFLGELRAVFKAEAAEHLKAITAGLMELEKAPAPETEAAIVEAIFREVHSLKGAARAVNRADIESICRSLETAFGAWKRGDLSISPELFDELHQTVDRVHVELAADGEFGSAELPVGLARAGGRAGEESAGRVQPAQGKAATEKGTTAETVRVATAKLDAVLLEAEELRALRLVAGQRAADLEVLRADLDRWQRECERVQPSIRALRRSVRDKEKPPNQREMAAATAALLGFLEWGQPHLSTLESRLAESVKDLEQDAAAVGGMVEHLVENVKQILMLPCSSLLDLCPRVVRDLARDLGKEVELVLAGSDVEIDRRILEQLRDPLIHLLRNAIDHGIEMPDLREANGKPRRGTVTVAVAQVDGNKVEFLVSDDGAGVDPSMVRAAASRRGVISPDEAGRIDDEEALSLIFRSGVSTSPIITDLSGRGLGLPIVREKVEKLGGQVAVHSSLDEGSSLRILLPITLASFRGLLVEASGYCFVLPIDGVERVSRVRRDEIRTVENRPTITVGGTTVSFIWLHEALGLASRVEIARGEDFVQVAVLHDAKQRIAFGVDLVLGEQEVLVKGLGSQLLRVRNVAGATVLGSGQVAPILNIADLMKSALKAGGAPAQAVVAAPPGQRRSILVVEDSITARMFLKNILESAGYQVATAVDGADAFATLRTRDFDLVVSDVDMPRLNGFDLTAKIRADKRLKELPVVLVTALESVTDRERGVDAGADAYIVKSSFVQSNLLDVIKRLL